MRRGLRLLHEVFVSLDGVRMGASRCVLRDSSAVTRPLRELDDLIQHAQNLGKSGIGHALHRVFFGAALAPVERLGLVAERVTRAACFAAAGKAYRHGEWVVGVVGRSGHGQADDQ